MPPLSRVLRAGLLLRPLALLVAVAVLVVQTHGMWAALAADPIARGAGEARALAPSITPNPRSLSTADGAGNVTLFPGAAGEQRIDARQLFPGASTVTPDDLRSAFGTPQALEARGVEARTTLEGQTSNTGEAYRTFLGSRLRSPPDLRDDPIWRTTRSTLSDLSNIARDFADCSVSRRFTPGSLRAHVPDLRTCDRSLDIGGAVNLTHDYTAGVIVPRSANMILESCGTGCIDVAIGRVGDNYWRGNCTIFEERVSFAVINPAAITSARLTYAKWDDYLQVWLDNGKVWESSPYFPPETTAPGFWGSPCELRTNWERGLDTDITAALARPGEREFRIRVSVTGNGEGYARMRIHYDPARIVATDTWTPPEAVSRLALTADGFCNASITCASMPPLDANGCTQANGVTVCPWMLTSPESQMMARFVNPLCRAATANISCGFAQGPMECWTDAQGIRRCPTNTGRPATTTVSQSGPGSGGVVRPRSNYARLETCGEGCLDVWIGRSGDNYWSGNCAVFEERVGLEVVNPAAIRSATLTYAKWDDYMQLLVDGVKVWESSPEFPPETPGTCELNTSWERALSTDLTSAFTRVGEREFRIRASVTGGGEAYGKLRILYDPARVVSGDVWAPGAGGGDVSPATDTCAPLRTNPSCAYVRSECVEGAQGASGTCYVTQDVYDCGYTASVPTLSAVREMSCDGPIRCMGTECIDAQPETNNNFVTAVAALQALSMIGSDAECGAQVNDPSGCQVFRGQAMTCKRAVGGMVNCCSQPGGVSLGDYLRLMMSIRSVDSAMMALDGASTLRSGWELLRTPVTSAWSAAQEMWTSTVNSVTGSTTAAASEAGVSALASQAQQFVMKQAAEWTAELFGTEAANALFSVVSQESGKAGLAYGADGVLADGMIQLGGGQALIGSMLSWVMAAYAIYQIFTVLVQIIWACEKPEFELAVKRQLKSCHLVGSYCASRVAGVCIERRESHCCFASPLSRIIQEQARPQFGRSWGSAQNPDCGGFTIAQLSQIDWASLDLSEWVGILAAEGMIPDALSINLDSLTGTGRRALGAADPSTPRPDAISRTTDRLRGIDVQGRQFQGNQELRALQGLR